MSVVSDIREGVPIKEDMVAHTTMLGVTGLLAIEIEGGTNGAPTLKPSPDHIPVIRTAPSWFDETKRDVGSVANRLEHLLQKSERLFSDTNMRHIETILANTSVLSAKGSGLIDEANRTLASYRELVKKLDRDMETITTSFTHLSRESIPMVKKLKETAQNFNRVTLKVERGINRGDYNLKKIFEPMLVEIEILSGQINDLAREMEASPSDILFKSRQRRKGPGE